MSGMRGGESYVAMPRWMGFGAIVVMVVVGLIAVAGIVSLGGRIRAVERRVASTARAVGDIEDFSARIENLAGRIDAARADAGSVRRLGARITSLTDDLAAHEREDRGKELAASLARLESSVTSLKADVIDAMRLAAKAAETPAAPSAPTAPAVAAGDLDRLADRVAGIESDVEELAKVRTKTSSSSSRPRINEDAVKKLVEETVKEQVEEELKAMRDRFRRR